MTVLEEIFNYYTGLKDKGSQENVIAMLREIQEAEGFISAEMKAEVAKALDARESVLNVILKMYPDLKTANYSHTVTLCTGGRCAMKGGSAIISAVTALLKPDASGISADGRIRLKKQNCLKQCKTSPNMLIDGQVYTHLTPEKAAALINALR